MSQYTDEDVKRAFDALGCRPRTIERMCDSGPVQECVRHAEIWPCGVGLRSVEAVLDAVAPAIAARALEDAADRLDAAKPSQMFALGWTAAAMAVRAVANLTGNGRI